MPRDRPTLSRHGDSSYAEPNQPAMESSRLFLRRPLDVRVSTGADGADRAAYADPADRVETADRADQSCIAFYPGLDLASLEMSPKEAK